MHLLTSATFKSSRLVQPFVQSQSCSTIITLNRPGCGSALKQPLTRPPVFLPTLALLEVSKADTHA